MNREDLVRQVADAAGLNKRESSQAVLEFMHAVEQALAQGDKVTIIGFGHFATTQRQARMVRNPRTGGKTVVPAHVVVKFRPGKNLSDAVDDQ